MDEEKVEQKIEEKIEEVIEDKVEGEETNEFIGQKLEEKLKEKAEEMDQEEKKGLVEKVKEKSVSRRDFMKMLGLGAGGLAFSSAASADLFKILPPEKGTSDVDADTVDGENASSLGGNVGFTSSKKQLTYGVTTSGSTTLTTANTSGTIKFYYYLNATNNEGNPFLKLDGSTIASTNDNGGGSTSGVTTQSFSSGNKLTLSIFDYGGTSPGRGTVTVSQYYIFQK